MKLFSIFLFTLLQFALLKLSAQVNIDSLKQIISTTSDEEILMIASNDYAFHQHTIQSDTAIYYANKALKIAIIKNNEKEIQSAYNVLGLIYKIKGQYNFSIENFKKALSFNKDDASNMGRVSHNLALTYKIIKKSGDALNQELKAVQFAEFANDSLLLGSIYQTMCNIYRDQNEFDEAEKYIKKALTVASETQLYGINNKISVVATIYSDYGNLLQASGRFNDAVKMHERSIEMLSSLGDNYNKAIVYENLADDFVKLKMYSKAVQNYSIAKNLMEQVESPTDVGYEFLKIANAYTQSGEYQKALQNVDSALAFFIATHADQYRMDGYKLKYEIYDLQNNATDALDYYKQYNNLNDSLNLNAQQNELMRLKTEFETTQKEQQIILLEAENTVKEKEKQRQILLRNIAIALIGLLLVFGVMIRNRYRIRQQVKQLQMRNNIAMDLHDEVGSSLSAIKMLSEIATTQQENKAQTTEILGKIVINATETAEKMHDIIWMINPKQEQMENITDRMERFLLEMCAPKKIRFEFINQYGNDLKLSMQQRKNLLLIFKEAVNNAAKYADPDFIFVHFTYQNKILELLIRDTGKGFDMETIQKGNGLISMQHRAKELHGILQINSVIEKGTEVLLKVKL